MLLVDALRALAATMIAWHHFSEYGPLSDQALVVAGGLIEWLSVYGNFTQVFFVVGGYVMARSMTHRAWDRGEVGRFVVSRYCRLGLPYLAAGLLAIAASEWGRGWLSEEVVGPPLTAPQVLANATFLQDILGYDSLSAGLWFVGIYFQLMLIYVATLYLRDALARRSGRAANDGWTNAPMTLGWTLAAACLFYFNLDDRWDMWAVYFYASFFLGVIVYQGSQGPRSKILLLLYALMMIAAIAYQWRERLVLALATGLVLFCGTGRRSIARWPVDRIVGYLGRTSYSLFLVHFSVLVVVEALWVRLAWDSAREAVAGLAVAYLASLAVADVFYRVVEVPAERLSRRIQIPDRA